MDHDEKELLIAARYGQLELVRYLIDDGVLIDIRDEVRCVVDWVEFC